VDEYFGSCNLLSSGGLGDCVFRWSGFLAIGWTVVVGLWEDGDGGFPADVLGSTGLHPICLCFLIDETPILLEILRV
jgi:hypothetical protein